MRQINAMLCGGSLLVACAGSGTQDQAAERPDLTREQNEQLRGNTVVGPICPSCVAAGGETSDFDGGQDPCMEFVRTVVLTDAEAEAAGFDVLAHRQGLERRFEAPLRWRDMTTTSALPRTQPMSGYLSRTIVRGSVTTGAVLKTFFDTSTCTEDRQCSRDFDGRSLDCSYTADWHYDAHTMAARLQLATDDGALAATLDGSLLLTRDGRPNDVVSYGWHADVAGVQGTLRVEPRPGARHGSLDLYLNYFGDTVRGRLELNFTSGWRALPGVPVSAIDEQPLFAALQEDDCAIGVLPTALGVAQDVLGGQTPADALTSLRAAIADTDASASWTNVGGATTLAVEIENPDYACVAPVGDVELASQVGRGMIMNVPVRLTSSDGLLDWPALASYELGGATADAPHRLRFEQWLTPLAPLWQEAFPELVLAPHTSQISVRFAARYPDATAGAATASAGASTVFEIFQQSGCAGGDLVCESERGPADAPTCIVSPPGGACAP